MFSRKLKLDKHKNYCTKSESSKLEFWHYTIREDDSFVVSDLIDNITPYQKYGLLFSEKIAIRQHFPMVWATGARRLNKSFLEFSSGSCTNFLVSVLNEKCQTAGANEGIYLHKNIKITHNGQLVARFTENFTRPRSDKFAVEDHGSMFFVYLKEMPKNMVEQNKITFENEGDDLVYNTYLGKTFLPHCHPPKSVLEKNTFRNPELSNPKLLMNLVGLPSKYWLWI